MGPPLLKVTGLRKRFVVSRKVGFRTLRETIRAVDGIDLVIARGETLGLVGESGCGKSTAGRAILRLIVPSAGTVEFEGADLADLRGDGIRALRADAGIVFQDPMSALNPRMMVGDIVSEPLIVHRRVRGRREALEAARRLLERVGLRPEFASRYPHEFSGGQRQRIGIARAISTDPKLLVLDEPISALDLSVRAQILNLLADLQEERGLAYLFISHDLSVVRSICDRVAVMYLGAIVEEGNTEGLFNAPKHPYTQALLQSVPIADPDQRRTRQLLEGDAPSAAEAPRGCRFRGRCPLAEVRCEGEEPLLRTAGDDWRVACHYAE